LFKIQADYDGQIEVRASVERVREFIGDARNFVELMPGVDSIIDGAGGVKRWTISANVPLIGEMRQMFPVRQTEDEEDRIEWSPVAEERKNLLRYSATFEPRRENRTLVRITQRVELRRERASEIHTLAGLIGERRISREMEQRVGEMMRTFLENARRKLES
jgi:hypothetical protein